MRFLRTSLFDVGCRSADRMPLPRQPRVIDGLVRADSVVMKKLTSCLAFGFVALFSFASCDKIDVLTDCQNICDKYQDCFDSDFDVSDCRDRCEENSDDEDFADDVSTCEDCIDDRDCVEGAFDCGSLCGGVVP